MLAHDPSDEVRAAVVDALANDPLSFPTIRKILAETIHVPPWPISGEFFELREAAVRALAADPDSEAFIRQYVHEPRGFWGESSTLQAILAVPEWRSLLLQKLSSPEVTTWVIKEMATVPEAESVLRELLDSADARIVQEAIRALGERVGRSKLMSLLTHPDEIVRCAAIGALAEEHDSAAALRRFLVGTPTEQVAAIKALSHDTEAMTVVGNKLLRSHSANVLTAAVNALSEHPIAFAALRERFDEWRLEPEYGQVDSNDARDLVPYGALRAKILSALASEPRYRMLLVEALNDPHSAVRGAAVRALAHDSAMLARLSERFLADDRGIEEVEAFRELMRDQPFVMDELLCYLKEDLAALRFVAFRHFVDHDEDRRRLKEMLLNRRLPEDWRATIVGPLMRDPTLHGVVRGCIDDPSRYVRAQTLRLLRHDRGVREALRDRLLDQARLAELAQQNWLPLRPDGVPEILASDPDAHPILAEHLASDNPMVVQLAASLLHDYPQARPKLVELLNHPYVEVQCAAMRALGEYEPVRETLVAALEPNPREDPNTDTEREEKWEEDRRRDARRNAAADALKDVPELRVKFRELLDHRDKDVREAAIHAVAADRSPDALLLLRVRLGLEKEEHLRSEIIKALHFDPASVDVLRERLQNDYQRNVRMQAAHALGFGDLMPAHAVRKLPSVARVCGVLAAPDDPGLDALRAFVQAPRHLDLDAETELGEQVLAWACARLGWAYELDREREGQVLGEVATWADRVSSPGRPLVMRVAMDVFDVPRERFLRPNHNLMVVWDVVRHVVAAEPPALVLACADVAFEHLQPPPLAPGEVRFGPTFFGFRLNCSKP